MGSQGEHTVECRRSKEGASVLEMASPSTHTFRGEDWSPAHTSVEDELWGQPAFLEVAVMHPSDSRPPTSRFSLQLPSTDPQVTEPSPGDPDVAAGFSSQGKYTLFSLEHLRW